MKVSYIGAFNDISGYADAARNNVCAISSVGVPIQAIPVSFEGFKVGYISSTIKHIFKIFSRFLFVDLAYKLNCH